MGIKTSIGKLELHIEFAGLAEFIATNRIGLLSINFAHIQRLLKLPFYHRDPFDRLLIAQAFSENLTLLSRDSVFSQYGVATQWH